LLKEIVLKKRNVMWIKEKEIVLKK